MYDVRDRCMGWLIADTERKSQFVVNTIINDIRVEFRTFWQKPQIKATVQASPLLPFVLLLPVVRITTDWADKINIILSLFYLSNPIDRLMCCPAIVQK